MFFFFPCSTDAPVYHWPYATVGLILVNFALFLGVPPDAAMSDPWVLTYGEGLWPAQWFCSVFMHAGLGHLLSNMVFLWIFGLIIEGKVGPLRFLIIYLAVGAAESALEQLIMFGARGESLGASSAIYGLMAIAALWAPDNTINFFYLLIIYFRPFTGTVEVPVLGVAAFFISLDLFFAMLIGGLGGGVTSSLLHLLGAGVGLPIGLALLKRKAVDCEGWDFLTRYGFNKKQLAREQAEAEAKEAAEAARTAERDRVTLEEARTHFDRYLAENNPAAAAQLYQKLRGRGDGWRLETDRLRAVVQGLHAKKLWPQAAPLMSELIQADPENASCLRVALAQLCVTQFERPARALELLAAADATTLSPKQRQTVAAIKARAGAMQDEGVVELDDTAW